MSEIYKLREQLDAQFSDALDEAIVLQRKFNLSKSQLQMLLAAWYGRAIAIEVTQFFEIQ